MSSTSLRVSGGKKAVAESIALEISNKCGKIIKVSEVLNFVLDENLKPTIVDDFIEKKNLLLKGEKE
ncbi:TPA: hypothetical protein ACPKB7_001790 [Haemophilus influenzae]